MKKILWISIKYLIILMSIILIISPIYFLFIVALFSNAQVSSQNQNLLPDGFNIQNFWLVIKSDNQFLNALGWTILFAFIATLIKTIILVFGGYGLSIMNKKTRTIIIFIFMFFASIPEIILYTGLYRNAISWDLRSSVVFLPLSAPLIFSFFSLIYFQNAFLSISYRFNKMTKIDHLTLNEKILYMFLPKIKISLIISSIFSLIGAWNSFLWPNILLNGTNIILLGQWFRTSKASMIPSGQLENFLAAGALITMIIPLIFYWISNKWVNKNFFNANIKT